MILSFFLLAHVRRTDPDRCSARYSLAAHCLEELILLSPHNHLTYLKYAMTLYTMGGIENLTLARAYFCKVLDLHKDNTRALIGLKLVSFFFSPSFLLFLFLLFVCQIFLWPQTCQALLSKPARSDTSSAKLSGFASSHLQAKFEKAPVALKKATIAALDSLDSQDTKST